MKVALFLFSIITAASAQLCDPIEVGLFESMWSQPSLNNISIHNCYERCLTEHGFDFDAVAKCLLEETGYKYTPKELMFYEDNIFP